MYLSAILQSEVSVSSEICRVNCLFLPKLPFSSSFFSLIIYLLCPFADISAFTTNHLIIVLIQFYFHFLSILCAFFIFSFCRTKSEEVFSKNWFILCNYLSIISFCSLDLFLVEGFFRPSFYIF